MEGSAQGDNSVDPLRTTYSNVNINKSTDSAAIVKTRRGSLKFITILASVHTNSDEHSRTVISWTDKQMDRCYNVDGEVHVYTIWLSG